MGQVDHALRFLTLDAIIGLRCKMAADGNKCRVKPKRVGKAESRKDDIVVVLEKAYLHYLGSS